MQGYGRFGPSNRGVKGRGNPQYRGGRSSGYTLAQYGNKKLIAKDLSEIETDASQTELEEFRNWKQLQRTNSPSSSSYSATVQNSINKEDEMLQNIEERVILLLDKTDKKWEDKPWTLYDRYLGGHGYTMETYKPRHFYEEILLKNGCTIDHFTSTNTEIYNFSKIIIGQIISLHDWGISPFTEKVVIIKGTTVKYNYWDYIQAFEKVFLYENDKRSHTWFIKINSEVYNDIPIWLINWWKFYGTTEKIFPSILKEYFEEWRMVIPSDPDIPKDMRFFIEFSIPYIWRSSPVTAYSDNILYLKRRSYTKFWDKMMRKDENGQLNCVITIDLIKEKIDYYTSQKEIEAKEIEEKRNLGKEKARIIELLDEEETMDIHEASKEQIIKAYIDSLKQTLKLKKEGEDKKSSKSDTSMASNTSQNSFSTLLQDAQNPDEDLDVDNIMIKWIQGEK